MPTPRKKPSYPTGRAALNGALILGIGLPLLLFGVPALLFKEGLPRGQGSGSEIANGMALLVIPFVTIVGAVTGAFLGELLALIVFAIAWLRAQRP